jgi:signal recognition particle subunit SEC65
LRDDGEGGWVRRMVVSEPRLSEVVELYESLGFEVRLEPVDTSDPGWSEEECTLCLDDPDLAERTRVVYTRRRSTEDGGSEEDDLFG